MLLVFFWKVMSWILLFHLLFWCHKIIFRETSSITVFGKFFTVLGTKTNSFCWGPSGKDCIFLVIFISSYISRYHFSQILELHSVLSIKKIFVTNFLNRFTQTPPPPPQSFNGQNPLTVMKAFCQCSVT